MEVRTQTRVWSSQKNAVVPISDFGDTKSVHLKVDGINVEWLEKSSVLYYWSNGKYQTIQTSD